MDEKEIKETDLWTLYNKHLDFARLKGMFEETDKCNNFFNGDQWQGLKVDGIEPVQFNFIKPIVEYKVSSLVDNLRAINYSAINVDGTEFRKTAKEVCDLFNQRAARVWEKDQMDDKCEEILYDAAIVGEGILYTYYDDDDNDPKNEILNKVDIFYGNENEPDIQKQPYIIAKKRMTVLEAQNLAEYYEVSKQDIANIKGDDDTTDEAGESAKQEVDNMVTVITKFYKDNGTIHFEKATKTVEICKDKDTQTTLYPFSHTLWTRKKGSARGEGEVRTLIWNQIETNKTILRRILTTKNIAYPQKIYHIDKISNPEAVNTVGGVIEVKGNNVDDVSKVFSITNPGQMSPDAEKIQGELINTTRELRSAGDIATGQVNPEEASGRAILAIQHASKQPLNSQNKALNKMLEDVARIWMEMWKVHSKEGIDLEELTVDPRTGEDIITIHKIEPSVLEKLRTSVKIDITPKGAFDKYAQELSLENITQTAQFMNTAWLEDFTSLLDNDATMPKLKLEDLVKKRKAAADRIRQIQQMGNAIQTRTQQLMDTGEIMPKEMEQYM